MTNVLLVTSNGVGMGHLTRQAAVALALGPRHTPTLFSLSPGLPLATGMGLAGEYCPSYDRPWIEGREWHDYLKDRLIAIVEETGAEAVLFDGVAPYPGIGMASLRLRDVAFIWLRRGMWQPGANTRQLRKAGYFDLIIEPEDLGGPADISPTPTRGDLVQVAPISLLEVVEPLSREEARRTLGLPDDATIAVITLGSGMLGDVVGPGRVATEEILRSTDWHLAIIRPAVARAEVLAEESDRIHHIKGVYPLVSYLNAFDVAVSSAGYNAVHELIPAGLATVLVANVSTRTDDQRARARNLADRGIALAAEDSDPSGIRNALAQLAEPSVRDSLAKRAAETRSAMRGAHEAATVTAEFGERFERMEQRFGVSASLQVRKVKEWLKGVLGREGTNRVRRVLGRPLMEGRRAEVVVVDGSPRDGGEESLPLVMSEEVTTAMLQSDMPVEHMLPGASDAYRRRRRELVDTYYDVVG